MNSKAFMLAVSFTVANLHCAMAQSNASVKPPVLPHFDLKDNYDVWEKDYIQKNVIPYYKFTEVSAQLPSGGFKIPPIGPPLFEQAFSALGKLDGGRYRIVTSPGIYDADSKRHIFLGLKTFDDGAWKSSYYHAAQTPDYWHSPLLSPNGKTVVLREGLPPDDRYNANNLFLWDIPTSRLRYVRGGPSDSRGVAGNAGAIYLPSLVWSPESRYLSYMRGGNTFGDYDPRNSDYSLYCMDTVSRQDHLVLKNAGLHWSWTNHGQILCSLVKPANQALLATRTGRPSVYAVNATGGSPKKLFDGGYYAQQSPNGQWIAFCDWPGKLFDVSANNVPEAVTNNQEKGLFLFHKPTGKRIFVGQLALEETNWPADAPLLQWSPDGRVLYILDIGNDQGQVIGTVYRMEIEQQQLRKLTELKFTPEVGSGYFRSRGISPDGRALYYEFRGGMDGPEGVPNQKFTLLRVSTDNGQQTPLAQLINRANENSDWDFRDESGINPAFAVAEKVENSLSNSQPTTKPIAKKKSPVRKSASQTQKSRLPATKR